MKRIPILLFIFFGVPLLSIAGLRQADNGQDNAIHFLDLHQVKINDPFWGPKLKLWSTTTANDVLDKFEAKHLKDANEQKKQNTFANFDDVAAGKSGTGHHAGFPWFDGLVYETIRGISDYLILHPDAQLEKRVDGYIDRIAAAQKADPDGYLNTYTQLMEPTHRWGDNGGFLRFQHDVYNAGMLIEAGIHYYQATGKTKLLEVATKYANYMSSLMGPAPKRNIVPSHAGPEEPMVKLYWLYKNHPALKRSMQVPVDEQAYYELVKFWIENRGNNSGYPLWATWGNQKSEQWIKEKKYKDGVNGKGARPSWGDYAQDSIPVFEQKTIEGHAVRATLLATGIATVALENRSPKYISTARRLWDNMTGRRMFVTGGVGAIHDDEKFGPDYFLPTDAYLETCAAVGAGFFSQRMNELTGDGKYMDELERTLYNNVLTGISLAGNQYTYQNPLNAHKHERWEWHECPCCPPMFLKITGALPGYIYSYSAGKLYVNLFIGSEAQIKLDNDNTVQLEQQTKYPFEGKTVLTINPEREASFGLKLRIPGWAQGVENPDSLYASNLSATVVLKVNGVSQKLNVLNGYTEINRNWKKGDQVELELPIQPRIISASEKVKDLKDKVAIAAGPLIYCLEELDNPTLDGLTIDPASSFKASFQQDLLSGINVIEGEARNQKNEKIAVKAIPYYAAGNRSAGGYKLWVPAKKQNRL